MGRNRSMDLNSESTQIEATEEYGSFIDGITHQWMREFPEQDLSNFLLAIYLQRIGRTVEHAYGRMCLDKFGISGADMRVLLALRRNGRRASMRPTDLYKALLVTSGAITKQIDRLSSLNLVERKPDPSFFGGFIVGLTRLGMKTVNAAVATLATDSYIGPAMKELGQVAHDEGSRFCLQLLRTLEKENEVGKPVSQKLSAKKRKTRTQQPDDE